MDIIAKNVSINSTYGRATVFNVNKDSQIDVLNRELKEYLIGARSHYQIVPKRQYWILEKVLDWWRILLVTFSSNSNVP